MSFSSEMYPNLVLAVQSGNYYRCTMEHMESSEGRFKCEQGKQKWIG